MFHCCLVLVITWTDSYGLHELFSPGICAHDKSQVSLLNKLIYGTLQQKHTPTTKQMYYKNINNHNKDSSIMQRTAGLLHFPCVNTLNSYDSSMMISIFACSPNTGFPISAILLASSSSDDNFLSGISTRD